MNWDFVMGQITDPKFHQSNSINERNTNLWMCLFGTSTKKPCEETMTPSERKQLNNGCFIQIMGYMTDPDFLDNLTRNSRLEFLSSRFQILPTGKGLNNRLTITPNGFDDIDTLVSSARSPKDAEIFSMRLGGKLATFMSWEKCEIGRTINHLMTTQDLTYSVAQKNVMNGCNVFHIESGEWFKDLDTAVIFAMQFNMKNKPHEDDVISMQIVAEFIVKGFGK